MEKLTKMPTRREADEQGVGLSWVGEKWYIGTYARQRRKVLVETEHEQKNTRGSI